MPRRKDLIRAVAYARFSSEMQRDESIDAQLRAIHEYAKKNGYTLVSTYEDRACSATSDQRPEFQRMIRDAKKSLFDVVLVHKLDRFARNRYDSAVYKRELKMAGVRLCSVLENFDDSPESVILESVLEGFNEYYSRNLAREVEKGKRENALKAIHVGGIPPLGYDVDPGTKKLVINEHEAAAVRMIFGMFLEGKGYTAIRDRLNDHGYQTKRGCSFGKNSLHEILRNEKYTGTYIYNRSAAKSIKGTYNRHAIKSEEDIIRIENAVPQVISKEDFQEVQRIFQSRRHRGACNKAKEPYLLSGKIICGKCGSAYVGNHRKAYVGHVAYTSYKCTRKNNAIHCDSREIRREDIEQLVLRILSDKVFDERLLPRIEQEYASHCKSKFAKDAAEFQTLTKQERQISKQIENIVLVMASTASAALADKLTELEENRERVRFRLDEMERQRREQQIGGEQLRLMFQQAKTLLAQGTLENRRQIVEAYVDRIVINDDRIEVCLNIGNQFQIKETQKRGEE